MQKLRNIKRCNLKISFKIFLLRLRDKKLNYRQQIARQLRT